MSDINKGLEWTIDIIKKYGLLLCVGMGLFYIGKKLWNWVAIPFLIIATSKQICLLFNWDWAEKLNLFYLICAWILLVILIDFIVVEEK